MVTCAVTVSSPGDIGVETAILLARPNDSVIIGRGSRGVRVINNRRTKEKNDDLEVLITGGPVFYEERRDLIWSDGWVQLLDTQTQPRSARWAISGMAC